VHPKDSFTYLLTVTLCGCGLQVAYTFDAGPNACLYLLEENVEMMLGLICHFFPQTSTDNGQNFVSGLSSNMTVPSEVGIFSYCLIEFIKLN